MVKIWKFDVPLQDKVYLKVPEGSRLLTVKAQGNCICAWFLVDVENKDVLDYVVLRVIGTGNPIFEEHTRDDDYTVTGFLKQFEYISTVLLYEDSLVFHIFRER